MRFLVTALNNLLNYQVQQSNEEDTMLGRRTSQQAIVAARTKDLQDKAAPWYITATGYCHLSSASLDMILLLLLASATAAHRGHYIVDYQRLPLYQEFYLSPGVYRPLFPGRQDTAVQEGRSEDFKEQQPVAQALQQEQVQSATVQEQQVVQDQTHVVQQQNHVVQQQNHVVQQQNHVVQEEKHVAQQHAVQSVPVLKYSNSMTHDGSYSYKYETADGLTREESSVMEPRADGEMVATVKGSYSYPGPDGRIIRVDYVADEAGFRATGDHLPSSLQDTVYNFKYVVP